MKKIISILILLICMISLLFTTCYADTENNTIVPSINTQEDYYNYPLAVVNGTSSPASTINSLPLYTSIDNEESLACYVPPTYYIYHISAVPENTEWKVVMYNDVFFYVKNSDLTEKTTDILEITFENNISPSFQHDLSINTEGSGDFSGFKIYSSKLFNDDSKIIILTSNVSEVKFIGLTMYPEENVNKICYFVSVTTTNNETFFGYVKPDMTNVDNINFLSIKNHPNYIEPTPEENPEEPQLKPSNPESVPATSNLVRNILIGVICILCLSVVIIIFKPNSKDLN